MRQIIWLHVGQAGVQTGSSCWELFCLEHGIQLDGKISEGAQADDDSYHTFFYETSQGKVQARAIFVDTDPMTIDELKKSKYSEVHNPRNLVSGKQSACIFSRGYYNCGRQMGEKQVLERVRKVADTCDNFQGFMTTCASGGGTGSGMGCYLTEKLNVEYGSKKARVGLNIFPSSKLKTSVLEPYHTMLTTQYLMHHQSLTIAFQNQSLYNQSLRFLDQQYPSYCDINRIIAQMASSLTSSIRFKGCLNTTLDQMITNLVPYPKFHFVNCAQVPFVNREKEYFNHVSVQEMTKAVFEPNSQTMETAGHPQSESKYLGCSLTYRGDVTPSQVAAAVSDLRSNKTINFAQWCPTGLKVAISTRPPIAFGQMANVKRSCTILSNNTNINSFFRKVCDQFDSMYCRRAFVHWYVGIMQEGQFSEAREHLACLQKDYEECVIEASDEVPEEQ